MELTEQEAHCVARLLQGAIYGDKYSRGCEFCKHQCRIISESKKYTDMRCAEYPMFDKLMAKFTKETGVDMTPASTVERFELGFFPLGQFLKNSNDKIKEYIKKKLERHTENYT